ncbi:uncharacterized protein LOC134260039 [Saccostrea cucullata]|uniref:uncharacterized protein LOC134260039 n=1 Tax=Saccostrea cuccullata TaxID=36930 RepID=UPI002ED41B76
MIEQGQTVYIMWTVFVPSHILNKSSCHLFGKVIEENSFVLISDIFNNVKGCEKSIGIFSQLDETELKTDEEGTHKPTKDLFIDLHCNRDGNITCKVTENFETLNCNLVIFDAEQFSDSYFMSWDSLSTVSGNVVNILSKEIQSSRPTVRKPLIHQLQMLCLFCFQIVGFLLDNR